MLLEIRRLEIIIVNIQQEDNSGGNYLVHGFFNDTCTFVLADTGSVHSIAYEGCYKTLLYTNPIIPLLFHFLHN